MTEWLIPDVARRHQVVHRVFELYAGAYLRHDDTYQTADAQGVALWLVPEAQGRGIGSALLREVLERADDEGMPAYLEATTPRSRALYERHGYVTRGEFALPDGGPTLWPMWRAPLD